jgi:hypothetical protein
MARQKLNKRKEQIIQIMIAIIAFFVFAIVAIIILPIAILSYAYTQLEIRSREFRKRLKEKL